MSHTVWVRGLKLKQPAQLYNLMNVAPRVGAWIEIVTSLITVVVISVAPRVGAWIEIISCILVIFTGISSHPVWVRGLKSSLHQIPTDDAASHPVWVRGLKSHKWYIPGSSAPVPIVWVKSTNYRNTYQKQQINKKLKELFASVAPIMNDDVY